MQGVDPWTQASLTKTQNVPVQVLEFGCELSQEHIMSSYSHTNVYLNCKKWLSHLVYLLRCCKTREDSAYSGVWGESHSLVQSTPSIPVHAVIPQGELCTQFLSVTTLGVETWDRAG